MARHRLLTGLQSAAAGGVPILSRLPRHRPPPLHLCRSTAASSAATAAASAALPFSAVPGPSVVPLLRNLPHMLPGGRYFKMPAIQQLELCRQEYGPIWKIELPWQRPMLFLARPEDVKEVFLADGPIPKRQDFEAFAAYRTSRGLGVGIAAAEGEQWKEYRELGQTVLGGPQSALRYVDKITDAADMFIRHLRSVRGGPQSTEQAPPYTVSNFQESAKLWAFESMNTMALGAPIGIYERDAEAARLFNGTMELFECFTELNQAVPLWRLFPTPLYRRMARSTDVVWDTCSQYVRRALAEPIAGSMVAMVADQVTSDRKLMMVTDIIGDLLLSSIDTTSTTLTYLIHCLAVHPECQERARQEVLAALPSAGDQPTADTIPQLSYLKACLKEALRIHHVTAGVGRVLSKELVLSGYTVPAGVRCVPLSMLMALDPHLFPEPERFLPERWLRSSPQYQKVAQYAYLPFGHGPRMCVGRRFAELESWVAAAQLLRQFRITTSTPEFGKVMKLINMPDRPIDFQLNDL
ncbi:cytochrome P450 CYP12A2-like [Amphibalanus amphitrite]|uniref:cytochrome P450 CYP12A2-like n=1 Tax=Amphibalanus amphitrite TaxID=1232801 RepID=UPI001C8FC62B|nr:cytochrome P450 CYP12A2-like [Amphibalanus amphitrite]